MPSLLVSIILCQGLGWIQGDKMDPAVIHELNERLGTSPSRVEPVPSLLVLSQQYLWLTTLFVCICSFLYLYSNRSRSRHHKGRFNRYAGDGSLPSSNRGKYAHMSRGHASAPILVSPLVPSHVQARMTPQQHTVRDHAIHQLSDLYNELSERLQLGPSNLDPTLLAPLNRLLLLTFNLLHRHGKATLSLLDDCIKTYRKALEIVPRPNDELHRLDLEAARALSEIVDVSNGQIAALLGESIKTPRGGPDQGLGSSSIQGHSLGTSGDDTEGQRGLGRGLLSSSNLSGSDADEDEEGSDEDSL